METQQVRDFITSKKMKKKPLSLKEEINVQFCLPTFRPETVKLPKNFNLVSRAFSLFPFPFLLRKKALGTRLTPPKTRP